MVWYGDGIDGYMICHMGISESLIEGVKTLCWLGRVKHSLVNTMYLLMLQNWERERKKEILKRTRDGLDFCKGQAANQPAMGKG
jgi:hypothetical protein